ncbi:MAG: PHP domain-containing protein [Lentisphaeria bacterium]|nr:PHP domain-containing protein [Lentisphaeria bacterium]
MTRFDLHVHTGLSACAENSLSPLRLVARARTAGIRLLAVTDHNACANVRAALRAGRQHGVQVIPGVEVTTREEVHATALFDSLDALLDWQAVIDRLLPKAPNRPDFFGYQVIYDETDEIVAVDERLRQVGIAMGIDEVAAEVHRRGGRLVPAHVFRARNSLTSQLGFIDPSAAYDAVEVSKAEWRRARHVLGDRIEGFPVITGSDAHFLEDVGRTWLEVPADVPTAAELFRILGDAHR